MKMVWMPVCIVYGDDVFIQNNKYYYFTWVSSTRCGKSDIEFEFNRSFDKMDAQTLHA